MEVQGFDLAESITKLREQRGWSQSELARRIGVSSSMVNMYEHGTNRPRMATLERMAAAFGISVPELITGEKPGALKYDEVLLLANYRKLNDEGKAALAKHAAVMVASGVYDAF